MNLCQYKNIFGKVGEGVHKYRIFSFAAVDIICLIIVAVLITFIFYKKSFLHTFIIIFIILFLLGIVLHRLFCVKTKLDTILFSDTWTFPQNLFGYFHLTNDLLEIL
jgi:hypothetical protein